MRRRRMQSVGVALLSSVLFGWATFGCATTSGGPVEPDETKLDQVNRASAGLNFWMLQKVVRPVALGWNVLVPEPLQDGIVNVVQNLDRPRDFLNSVLQGKPERAGRHLGTFLLNSTLGVGGLFYISDRFLEDTSPETTNETLGVWKIPAGPYLVVPVYGETSPRAIVGAVGDTFMNPLTWIFGGVEGLLIGGGRRAGGSINDVAVLMPAPWASKSEWQAFEEVFSQRTPYTDQKRLYFENQLLDVED